MTTQEILADIFENSERPDKIKVSLNKMSRDLMVTYSDLDDEWFSDLVCSMVDAKEPDDEYPTLEKLGFKRQELTATQQALDTLKQEFKDNPALVSEWHTTLACAAIDEGARHSMGNAIASRFMKLMFDVEVDL